MAKVYLFLLVFGLIGGVGYTGYSYYTWSEETIGTLRENNVKLKSATETLQNTVDSMQADIKKAEELNQNLTKRLQQSNAHLDKLRNTFAKIDLTMEALTNANGLEERVDNAVTKLINQIELETTPPTDRSNTADGVFENTGN